MIWQNPNEPINQPNSSNPPKTIGLQGYCSICWSASCVKLSVESAKQSARSSPKPSCVKRHAATAGWGLGRSAYGPRKTKNQPKKGEECAVWSCFEGLCDNILDIIGYCCAFFMSRCPFDSFLLYHSIGLFILPWRFNSLYNDVMEKVKCLWVARNSSTCYMIVPWWHVRFGRFLVSHLKPETWFPTGSPEN